MLTARERFICLVDNEPLRRADVIFLLEGDGYSRVARAVELFQAHWAPMVVITGGLDDPQNGAVPARLLKAGLRAAGVPDGAILTDEDSLNTRDQAVAMMRWSSELGWGTALLVASQYHQYRAYLTFLKAMQEHGLDLCLVNAGVRDLPWHRDEGWGRRIDLLETEFEKIEKYRHLGHVASFEEAVAYAARKEER